MRNLLAEIVEHKRAEVSARKAIAAGSAPVATATQTGGYASTQRSRFLEALSGDGLHLIAEVKPKSPSAGALSQNNLDQLLAAYGSFAHALSVLTDEKYFAGNLDLLRTATARTGLPALCKDFFIDEFQVHEAHEAGAEAILLIVKILDDEQLLALHQLAIELGMTPVVEIQNQEELSRAMAVSPRVLLINNRDLTTFEINFDTTKSLSQLVGDNNIIVVSASGIENRADIEELLPFARRFLVGSSIMRSENPHGKLKELLAL